MALQIILVLLVSYSLTSSCMGLQFTGDENSEQQQCPYSTCKMRERFMSSLERLMTAGLEFGVMRTKGEKELSLPEEMSYEQNMFLQVMYGLTEGDAAYVGFLSRMSSWRSDGELVPWIQEYFDFTGADFVEPMANLAKWSDAGLLKKSDIDRVMSQVAHSFRAPLGNTCDRCSRNKLRVSPSILERMFARDSKLALTRALNQGFSVDTQDTEGRTLFYAAVERNDTEAMDLLLKSGANPNIRVADCNSTLLHLAVRRGQAYVLERLVKYFSDLNVVDCKNVTVLQSAIAANRTDLVSMLLGDSPSDIVHKVNLPPNIATPVKPVAPVTCTVLTTTAAPPPQIENETDKDITPLLREVKSPEKCRNPTYERADALVNGGAKLNYVFPNGDTYIHKAVRMNDLPALTYFLERGLNVDALNFDNETALALAISSNSPLIVFSLLNNKAATNTTLKGNESYIHLAVKKHSVQALETLLKFGLSPDLKDADGKTPLIRAAEGGSSEMIGVLASHVSNLEEVFDTDNKTLLQWASKEGNAALVKTLLDKGAKVNLKDRDGWTALHYASWRGHKDVVDIILKTKEVDINAEESTGWTALHLAANPGYTEVVRLLLDNGALTEKLEKEGSTPLVLASKNGHKAIVQLLLQKGASYEAKDKDDWTPLHWAARNGHSEVVQELISKGAPIETMEKSNWTALHLASRYGQTEAAKVLIDAGALLDVRNQDGWTALLMAARNDHIEILKLLLAKGADVKATTPDGWTALQLSARHSHNDVVRALLEKGVPVNVKKDDGWTALHLTARNGHLETTKLLVAKGAEVNEIDKEQWTPLHMAARYGYADVVRFLIDKGANINAKEEDDWTALHMASRYGQKDAVKVLVSKGASIDDNTNDGWNSLQMAARNDHSEVVQILLEHNALINRKKPDGWTALQLAARNGYTRTVELLLEKGALVDLKNEEKWTALHMAARHGHIKVVKLLLARGATVDILEDDEWTPLMMAVRYNHLEVTKALIDRGASLDKNNDDGWSPLHMAARNGYLEICKVLVESGASINAKKPDGWTALHLAAFGGHAEIAKLLLEKGAEVNARNDASKTPLTIANENKHKVVVDILRKNGGTI